MLRFGKMVENIRNRQKNTKSLLFSLIHHVLIYLFSGHRSQSYTQRFEIGFCVSLHLECLFQVVVQD